MVCLKDDGTETTQIEVLMLFVINGNISEKDLWKERGR